MGQLYYQVVCDLLVYKGDVGRDALVLPVPYVDGAVQSVVAYILYIGVQHHDMEGPVSSQVPDNVIEELVPSGGGELAQGSVILLCYDLCLRKDVAFGAHIHVGWRLHLLAQYVHDLLEGAELLLVEGSLVDEVV